MYQQNNILGVQFQHIPILTRQKMKKYISMILLMGCVGFNTLHAQIADRLVPHLGFMYEFVTIATQPLQGSEPTQVVRNFYTFNIGTYYSAFHKNDLVSLGIEPNLNVGFDLVPLNDRVAFDYIIQTPVYLMGRLGAQSTKYNTQRFGIGAGIGGTYTHFSQQVTLQNRNKAHFFVPQAVVQATFGTRNNIITARAHFSLTPTESTLQNSVGSDGQFNFSNWGLGIVYSF